MVLHEGYRHPAKRGFMQRPSFTAIQAWLSPRKIWFWLLALLACYTLAGFFLIPWLIKNNINELAQQFATRSAEVREVRFNPWTLRLQANGLVLRDTDQAELAAVEQLVVDVEVRSVAQLALVFKEISLTDPHVNLIHYKFADTNFGRMLADIEAVTPPEPKTASEDSELPKLVIDNLTIANGSARFRDEFPATPFETSLGPIDINVENLSTLPDKSGAQQISVVTETGSTLKWVGDLQISPLKSAGKVELSGSPVPLAYRYLKDQLNFRIKDCCLDVSFDYAVESVADGGIAARIENVSISSRELELLTLENDELILQVPEIRVSDSKLEWPARAVSIGDVLIDAPKLWVWIQPDGAVNLNTLLPAADDANASSPAAIDPKTPSADEPAAEQDWNIGVKTLRVAGMQVEFADRSLANPGKLTIPKLDLTVNDLSNQPASKLPFSIAAQIGKAGKLEAQGVAVLLPETEVDTGLKIADIAISDLQPWVEPVAQILISDGLFSFTGQLSSNAKEQLSVAGDIDVSNLAVSDTRENVPLIGWQRLKLRKTQLELTKGRLSIGRARFEKPFARLIINADGTTNFQGLQTDAGAGTGEQTTSRGDTTAEPAQAASTDRNSVAGATATTAAGTADQESAPFIVSVDKTQIRDGSVEFADFSLPLPFEVPIRDFHGSISALATDSAASSDIALEGTVGEYGFVKVDGSLQAMAPSDLAKVNVIFRNINMPDVSPYTVKFAGRKIAAGKLDLDLNYAFDKGVVAGQNKIVLEKFQLGEKVDAPGAQDLPLDLAVSLLTDSNGIIDLELEVSGDLNDPTFSTGSMIMKVLANLITKAVTAPFKLLAGLLPGNEDIDLDTLDFPPGRADLLPPEQEKLDQLTQALKQRPQLVLTIPGEYNRELDTAALQSKALDAQLAKGLSEATSTDEQDVLMERTRNALEKLAREQLPNVSLDELEAQFQVPVPDSKRTTLDEAAYTQELGRLLEAAQPVSDEQLLALAVERQDAIRTRLTTTDNSIAGQLKAGTPGSKGEVEKDNVRMRMEVEAGGSNPVETAGSKAGN